MSTLILFLLKFSVIYNVKLLAQNIVISDLQITFRKQFIGIFTIHLQAKFHIPMYEQ
jgi:hypothetical protein